MNGKDYFIAAGLSAATGLALIFIIWLLSLVSWALVWAIFAFAFVPFGMKIIQFWRDSSCMDLSDFFIEADNYFKDKQKKKKSSIDNDIDDIDW